MTALDAALALLAAVLAWEWRVARQDCRLALDAALHAVERGRQATREAQATRRQLAAYRVWQ